MASMHFWGIDVKGKEPGSVKLEEGQVIHVSQATLADVKKDNEPVIIHVKVGDKKFVMGILSQSNPQLSFDLVFDQDFEISHNWKNGSIHLLGYQPEMHDDEEFSDFSDEDEDMPVSVPLKENGKSAAPTTAVIKAAGKPNKDNKPKVEEKAKGEDDDSDDDEDDSEDDDDSDEDMLGGSDDSDEDDDSEDDDDEDSAEEETPKVEAGKKRGKPDVKTPEPKKAKLVTPQKTDGKKGGHTATPHPAKKGGKTPGGDKSTPKSGGQVSCGSCKKNFNSEVALQSHNKAKHSK